jgi:hypothetical protein
MKQAETNDIGVVDPKALEAKQLETIKDKIRVLLNDTNNYIKQSPYTDEAGKSQTITSYMGVKPGRGLYMIRAIGTNSAFAMFNLNADSKATIYYQTFQIVAKGVGCFQYNVNDLCKTSMLNNEISLLKNDLNSYTVKNNFVKNPTLVNLVNVGTKDKEKLNLDLRNADPVLFQDFYLVPEHGILCIFENKDDVIDTIFITKAKDESSFK